MPVKTFWMLYRNINRHAAQNDLRTAHIMASVQSSEGFSALIEGLKTEIGTIVDLDKTIAREEETLDRAGLQKLASMNGMI